MNTRRDFLVGMAVCAAGSGCVTSVVSLGEADLVLLDALKGADDRPLDDMGPVEGTRLRENKGKTMEFAFERN